MGLKQSDDWNACSHRTSVICEAVPPQYFNIILLVCIVYKHSHANVKFLTFNNNRIMTAILKYEMKGIFD